MAFASALAAARSLNLSDGRAGARRRRGRAPTVPGLDRAAARQRGAAPRTSRRHGSSGASGPGAPSGTSARSRCGGRSRSTRRGRASAWSTVSRCSARATSSSASRCASRRSSASVARASSTSSARRSSAAASTPRASPSCAGTSRGMFGQERPLSLRAQLAFEQSYGEIDGDSASSSELFAVLSALADVGIDQGVAVTGSVNQLGEMQAIGGVCAKIEGFFDLCAARGLTGAQGVLLPRSNLPHLVLRDDVAEAVAAGQLPPVRGRDGVAGHRDPDRLARRERDEAGRFPAASVFGRVERRIDRDRGASARGRGPPSRDDGGRGVRRRRAGRGDGGRHGAAPVR